MFYILCIFYESLCSHKMNAEQRQVAADLWTKPTDLSHKPAHRRLGNYIHHRHSIIAQLKSWCSFYYPMEDRRLSRPRWLVVVIVQSVLMCLILKLRWCGDAVFLCLQIRRELSILNKLTCDTMTYSVNDMTDQYQQFVLMTVSAFSTINYSVLWLLFQFV